MRLHHTSIVSAIKLTEKGQVPKDVQVLRVGKFKHPSYGTFEITTQVLSEMKAHFDNRIRGIDTAFDYYHESNEDASGWVESLELREGGKELWAIVDWTPTATRKLADREVRYFSPDFSFKWTDPESGVEYNNVLFGGGLTNRPFVKEMKAIVAHEKPNQGKDEMTELEKAQAALKAEQEKNLKLSEEKATVEKQLGDVLPKADKVAALEKQIADLQAELAKEKAASETMLAEKVKADEAAKLAEKTSAFNILLSEGKAVAAQKDAFIKGDMNEFIKLAQPTNMKGAGSSSSSTTPTDREAKVLKLAEEKMAADKNLTKADAISIALKEVK